jgi:hypothetical protein
MYLIQRMSGVKMCSNCQVAKNLEEDFYKAGKSWQRYCKPCHNARRLDYPRQKAKRVLKLKGFAKLSEEIQNNIKYDIYVRIAFTDIARKYDIKYSTLLSWKRKGIPPHVPEAEVVELAG